MRIAYVIHGRKHFLLLFSFSLLLFFRREHFVLFKNKVCDSVLFAVCAFLERGSRGFEAAQKRHFSLRSLGTAQSNSDHILLACIRECPCASARPPYFIRRVARLINAKKGDSTDSAKHTVCHKNSALRELNLNFGSKKARSA